MVSHAYKRKRNYLRNGLGEKKENGGQGKGWSIGQKKKTLTQVSIETRKKGGLHRHGGTHRCLDLLVGNSSKANRGQSSHTDEINSKGVQRCQPSAHYKETKAVQGPGKDHEGAGRPSLRGRRTGRWELRHGSECRHYNTRGRQPPLGQGEKKVRLESTICYR